MSATASSQVLTSVRIVGGLLPADMLTRIAEGKDVSGVPPSRLPRRRRPLRPGRRRTALGLPQGRLARPARRDRRRRTRPVPGSPSRTGCCRCSRSTASAAWSAPRRNPVDDRAATFPVTHRWRHVPIHLVGWDTDLDQRPAGGGLPPQSMLQECLNRTDEHLWGILSNGRQLRLLRDSTSLAGAAYIEIDLEAMFDGELFDEFVLLYRLLHVSRFEVPDGAAPSACWLETWRTEAIEAGARALDQLRDGVQDAIAHLGTGFLRHPANAGSARTWTRTCSSARCCAWCTGCCSGSSPRTATSCSHPDTDETDQAPVRRSTSPPAGSATSALRRIGTSHGDLWQAVRLILERPRRRGRPAAARPAGPRRHLRRHRHRRRSCAAWSCPTSTCSPRSSRWPGSATSPRTAGGGSTTATSAPKNSARSTSPSSSSSRSGARPVHSSSST